MGARRLEDACSVLRAVVPKIIADYERRFPGREVRPVSVLRTDEEQATLYAQGRTAPGRIVTKLDGAKKKSRHQRSTRHGEKAAHAVDLGVFVTGDYREDAEIYLPFVTLALMYGVTNGADWNRNGEWSDENFLDAPHFQC